jgi:diguanylate cyclase (GGDEF)-like protein
MSPSFFGADGVANSAVGRRRRAATPYEGSQLTDSTVPAIEDSHQQSLDLLIGNIAQILNSEVALYCQPDGTGQSPKVICSWGMGPHHEPLARPGEGGFVGRALWAQRAALEPLDRHSDAGLLDSAGGAQLTHAVAAPVASAGGAAGTLIAAFSTPPPDRALTVWTAESCAAMVALAAHQPGALDVLFKNERFDSLTGCVDYAGTLNEIDREIQRSTRADLSLSICFIDLDNFKRVNSEHGHLHGNEVLMEVAQLLRSGVRSYDTVGRFGGDEFIVILPGTPEKQAVRLAERLQARLASSPMALVDEPITVSIGVARWTPGTAAEQLVARADEALRFAKARTVGIADRGVSRTSAPGPLQ